MNIAVLGASGVAGRAFVPLALAHGHALETRRTDILDRAALIECLQGCDAVVNLATSIPAPGGRGKWARNDRIRREGTANLLAACAALKQPPILIQQSVAMLHSAADDMAQAETGRLSGTGVLASAVEMEGLIAARAQLDSRVVRGGLFYGPGTGRREQWQAELGDPAFQVPGDGSDWVSWVHVEDFASAILSVLERGPPRSQWIACDDAPVRMGDLYAQLARRAGVKAPPSGGPKRMASFRVSNAKLRGIGWVPTHDVLGDT